MEHSGGFDKYILNLSQETMSKRAFAVRQRIKRKISNPGTKKKAAAPAKAESKGTES